MSERKYTEEEIFEAGKNMLEGRFRFIEVFRMVKQKAGDDEALRLRVMERLKETEASKVIMENHIHKPPKKVDYAGITLGVMILALGYIIYEVGLSTGYILLLPIIVMGGGLYTIIRSL